MRRERGTRITAPITSQTVSLRADFKEQKQIWKSKKFLMFNNSWAFRILTSFEQDQVDFVIKFEGPQERFEIEEATVLMGKNRGTSFQIIPSHNSKMMLVPQSFFVTDEIKTIRKVCTVKELESFLDSERQLDITVKVFAKHLPRRSIAISGKFSALLSRRTTGRPSSFKGYRASNSRKSVTPRNSLAFAPKRRNLSEHFTIYEDNTSLTYRSKREPSLFVDVLIPPDFNSDVNLDERSPEFEDDLKNCWIADNLRLLCLELDAWYIKNVLQSRKWPNWQSEDYKNDGYPHDTSYRWQDDEDQVPKLLKVQSYVEKVFSHLESLVFDEEVFKVPPEFDFIKKVGNEFLTYLFRMFAIFNSCPILRNEINSEKFELIGTKIICFGYYWKLIKEDEFKCIQQFVDEVLAKFEKDMRVHKRRSMKSTGRFLTLRKRKTVKLSPRVMTQIKQEETQRQRVVNVKQSSKVQERIAEINKTEKIRKQKTLEKEKTLQKKGSIKLKRRFTLRRKKKKISLKNGDIDRSLQSLGDPDNSSGQLMEIELKPEIKRPLRLQDATKSKESMISKRSSYRFRTLRRKKKKVKDPSMKAINLNESDLNTKVSHNSSVPEEVACIVS